MLHTKEIVPSVLFGGGFSGGTLVMSQNLSDQVSIESWLYSISSDDGIGVPITLIGDTELWTSAYYRYFLEQTESTEIHLSFKPKKNKGQGSQDLGKDAFRQGCKRILKKRLFDVSNEDFLKAKRWCVTHTPLDETKFKGKTKMEWSNSSFWNRKKTKAESEIKSELEKVKTVLVDNVGTNLKRVFKWCTMVMKASDEYALKDKADDICFNGTVEPR